MKKNIFLLLISLTAVFYKPITASAQVSVQINIGSQPVWGPVGYDYVEYYYLPDIEVYYYVPTGKFIYLSNGRWVFASSLPYRYRYYDLYTGYKVVINEPRPYLQFHLHKVKYATYKGYSGKQVVIKNSNDPKYFVVKGHPRSNNKGGKEKSNGKGNGKGKH